jgi:uncharacterized protein YkwD
LINFAFIGPNKSKIFSQRYDEEINTLNPNYALLNAGLFRAANEVRAAYNLPLFELDPNLQKVAEAHAKAMIDDNFYSHTNPNSAHLETLSDRVAYQTGQKYNYYSIGENIASYDILATEGRYCVQKSNNGRFFFFDCYAKKRIPIYTYKQLAVAVLKGWLGSPSHRENLLDPKYIYFGTAARLSKNAYLSAKPPFARIVQNFGSKKFNFNDI